MADLPAPPGRADNASQGQLGLTEAQTTAVLERASDLSALLDRTGRVLWVSPALPALWGYTPDSIVGAPMWDWVHPEDLAEAEALLRRVVEVPGAHDRIEVRLRDGGGDWRWTEQQFTNLLQDQSVAAMVATTTDITARRTAEIELAHQDQFFTSVFAGATEVAHVCDADTTFRWVSPSVPSVCGYEPAHLLGTQRADLVHPAERAAFDALIASVLSRPGSSERGESRVRHADGTWGWSEQRVTNMLDDPVVQGLVFNNVDITSRKTAHEELQSSEQFLRVVLETAHEGVWVLDLEGRTVYANRRMAEMLRVPVDMLIAHPLEDLIDPLLAVEIRERLVKRAHGVAEDYELHVSPHGGSASWVAISAAPLPAGFTKIVPGGGTVALVADITDRKAHEESLRRHALYDPVTGLPNRALLAENQRALEDRYSRDGDHFSYLLVDLDGLSDINNAFGSSAGDHLLREVGQRLVDASRSGDCVARATGDRFVVLCPGAQTYQGRRLADDLTAAIQGAVTVGDATVWPTVSIGVASTADVQPDELASAADSALYRAKRHGRGTVGVFDSAAPRDHRASLEMLADLREATGTGALRLNYQPVVDTATNRVVGAEALMRWKRPGHGEVPPTVFIPLAEEAGLINELGAWSLKQACRDAATWPGQQHVAVNLSARQLLDGTIVETVASVLDDTGLAADRLWIEVTETAVLTDLPAAAGRLREIVGLGVQVALDDFGTGYSSLVYLRDLPVSAIKIDRSFVAGVSLNRDDEVIVKTLINLATTLGLRAIAEGIENPDQLHLLQRMGCEFGQGYLWSPAVAASAFPSVVTDIQGRPSPDQLQGGKLGRKVNEAVMSRVLSMYAQGASPASIASALNAEAVEAPSGKRWQRAIVAQIINEHMPARE